MKRMGCRFRADRRKYFFTQGVIKLWNLLPEEVVISTGTDSVDRVLDRFMEDNSLRGY